MISKVSNNNAFARHNFMCGVKTKRKFAVIILALHLAAAPAVAIAAIASVYGRDTSFELCQAMAMIGVCTTALAGLLGIYLAIDSFSCLHNKNVVDMRLSLPLNASQRFFSNYLAGLSVYILPFLAAQVVSVLAMSYGCIFMDGKTFERYIGTNPDTGKAVYNEYVCRYFGQFMPVLLKLILCGVLVMLMLYTLSVLVTVCCGNIFESIGSNLLINAVIPFTILFVFESMFMNLYGLGKNGEFITIKAIMLTSPAGGIAAAAVWALDKSIVDDAFEFKWAVWLPFYVLLTAVMFAGAFFLYKKRRAQQTGKPFVFKFIYYVISTALMFFMTAMFEVDGQSIVTTVLATFLVYLILECITRRGFKRIWVGIIRYACTIAASVLLIHTAQTTEGFGMVERVPNVSSVKSVEINYTGFYGMLPLCYECEINVDDYYSYRKPFTLTFTEKENIETIIAAHQKRVDNRDWGLLYDALEGSLTIKYNLTGGRKLTRTYEAFTADELEILSRLDLTDEYKTQVADMYRNGIKNFPQEYEAELKLFDVSDPYARSNLTYTSVSNASATLESIYCRIYGKEYRRPEVSVEQLVRKGFYEQLAEAYAADIMNISEENYYNSSAKESYYLYMVASRSLDYRLNIPGSFKNTIELMEYFGFEFDKIEDIPDDNLTECLQGIADNNGDVRIYSAKEWRSCFNVPADVRLHGDYSINHLKTCGYIKDIDEDVIKLFKAAEPMNILPENGYIIYVSGETGVIPSELNGIAERVHEGAYGPADDRGNPFWLVSNYDEAAGAEVYTETQPNLLTEVSD